MKLKEIISLDFSVYNEKINNKLKLFIKFLYYVFIKPEFKVIFWMRLASYYKKYGHSIQAYIYNIIFISFTL